MNSLELIFRCHLLFDELGGLGADLGQVLADLAAHVLVDLKNLQLRFRNLALGLGGGGDELATFAVKPVLVPL